MNLKTLLPPHSQEFRSDGGKLLESNHVYRLDGDHNHWRCRSVSSFFNTTELGRLETASVIQRDIALQMFSWH